MAISRPRPIPQSGFSLLEVLIALAIVSFAVVALTRAIGQHALASQSITEQTFANWALSNVVTEFRLTQPWPDIGSTSGRVNLGRTDWFWEIRVSQTDVDRIRRIEAQVFVDPARDNGVASLIAFAGR